MACPSSNECVYRKSAFARGKVQNLDLVRPKDMVVYIDVDPDKLPEDVCATEKQRNLSAADRQRQRGVAACASILRSVLSGVQFGPDAAVCVVEWHACVAAEWLRAVRLLQNEHLSGNSSAPDGFPSKIWALAFSETDEETLFLNSRLKEECYNAWYNSEIFLPDIGRVGVKELPPSEHPPMVPKPELKLGYIAQSPNKGEVLVLPDSIQTKFEANEELKNRWQVFKATHVSKFGDAQQAPSSSHTVSEGKPDFSYAPPPSLVVAPVAMENYKKVADIEAIRKLSFKLVSKNGKLPMHLCQDADGFSLWADGTELDKDLVLPAVETVLFGFGLGKWAGPGEAAPDRYLKFEVASDLVYLTVRADDGSKKTARVCEHLEELRASGKEAKVAYHAVNPMTNKNTGKLVNGRYMLSVTKEVCFVPKALSIDDRVNDGKPVHATEVGACYREGNFGDLPSSMAAVVFDCTLIPGASCSEVVIRPTQPKLLLTQELIVPKACVIKIQ